MVSPWKNFVGQGEAPVEFVTRYLSYVAKLLEHIDSESVARLVRAFEMVRDEGRTLFVAGNGGSAATASHLANDFAIGTRKIHRDLPVFRVVALTDNVPLMTAVANDISFEEIFVAQLETLYRPGDMLLVISASGNSENLVRAAQWVKGRGGLVLGLLGFDGGRLGGIANPAVVVTTAPGEYGPVEDAHMVLGHLVTEWLKESRT